LSGPQLTALQNATNGKTDPVSQAIQNAVADENKRRAAEQRKKENQQGKQCQQKENCKAH
jgi:hypothetical protein